jgi:hypothetical protein
VNQFSDELYLKLTQGPAFLLLGQDYLRLESGRDPLLSEVLRKYGKVGVEPPDYRQILEGEAQKSSEEALDWMGERCRRFLIPEWLKIVASFQWNGVYTSAIDDICLKAFEAPWRELQPVANEKIKPTASRTNLHYTFLFGKLNWPDDDKTGQPPLSRREFNNRKPVAVKLADRLPELITYFGVLVIEGYAGLRDWLAPQDLFPVVDKLSSGQTHIFSVTDELRQNEDISDLCNTGKLVIHTESLASYLFNAQTGGFIQLGQPVEEEKSGRRIHIDKKTITIPQNIWNDVLKSAIILDDAILIPPPPISVRKRASEFCNFLLNSSTRTVWSGYERGFYFQRDFETKLTDLVNKELISNEPSRKPIIIHGSTATGKTVALGYLAYKIHKNKKRPVIFIEQKSQSSYIKYDIDLFFEWLESNYEEVPKTLLIWDGMQKIDEYQEFIEFLDGRGHNNFLLVGSCYSIKKPKWLPKDNIIECPSRLGGDNTDEIIRFENFIKPFSSYLAEQISGSNLEKEDYFLALLYRLFKNAHYSIKEGLPKELSNQIYQLKEILNSEQDKSLISGSSLLAEAFLKAKLIPEKPVFLMNIEEIGGEELTQLDRVINLVIVAGQFNIKVPFQVIMRAIGQEGVYKFASLFQEIDIIQWIEDRATGNISLCPRHSVEAKVLVRVRLGGLQFEIDYIKELLLQVRDNGDTFNNPQISFAIELIQNLTNQHIERFYKYLDQIAKALDERDKSDVQNPALMLQEAKLLREFVVQTYNREKYFPENSEQLLDQAIDLVYKSIELVNVDKKQQLSTHLVELATILGRKAQLILEVVKDNQKAIQIFNQSRHLSLEALTVNPENYYAAGTIGWATEYFLKSGVLDPETIGEACNDFRNAYMLAYENLNNDFEPEVLETFRLQIAKITENNQEVKQAFEILRSCNSSLGYYIQAFSIVEKLWPFNQKISQSERHLCEDAVNYLEVHRQEISRSKDTRALYLLLKLWWLWKTGLPMFSETRQTVNLSGEEWEYCNNLVIALRNDSKFRNNPSLMYFNGLATFHLGQINESLIIFRNLRFEADSINSSRRRIRYYLASSSDGQPKKYSGLIRGSDRKGSVWVPEFAKEIKFIPIEFFAGRAKDISQDKNLPEFHIAFSFLGPIVDKVKP